MNEENICPECEGYKREEYDLCFECRLEQARDNDELCECGRFKKPQFAVCYTCFESS